MGKLGSKILQRLRRNPSRWIVYVLIALLAIGVEMGGELFRLLGISPSGEHTLALSMLYQRFVTAGYQKPKRLFVRIVVLSRSYEPQSIFGDVCKKREFEAALLEKLARLSPSMVVMDFWYSPQMCADGDDASRQAKLQSAISTLSAKIPIVVGLGSQTEHELKLANDPELNKLKAAGFGATDLILDPRFDFSSANISYGLVRIDADTRRIPLVWPIFQSKAAVLSHSKQEQLPSLSYQAAATHDPQLPAVFSGIDVAGEHPFTSFIPESEFDPVHAIDLVCGGALNNQEDWTRCAAPDVATDSRFTRLKGGQIILIAENSQRDHFQSVIGEVPGYLLQANYIEALAGKSRFFRPCPPSLELLLTGSSLILIVILFDVVSDLAAEWWKARRWPIIVGALVGAGSCYVVIVAIVAICNLVAVYLGWFMGFWLALLPIPILEFFFKLRSASAPGSTVAGELADAASNP